MKKIYQISKKISGYTVFQAGSIALFLHMTLWFFIGYLPIKILENVGIAALAEKDAAVSAGAILALAAGFCMGAVVLLRIEE